MTSKKGTLIFTSTVFLCITMVNCSGNTPSAAVMEPEIASETESIESEKSEPASIPEASDTVQGWAVLAAKEDYSDVGMNDLLVDYIDNTRMRDALLGLGWNSEQIHELEGFDRESLQTELDWLQNTADENDVVLFYVTAHGKYLSDIIGWSDFFPEEWSQIVSERRLLIVDACQAELFTDVIKGDDKPHISIAAVNKDELGWKGLEEEGLPIVGGVFTYYFSEALSSTKADYNNDGLVSTLEATIYAEKNQKAYMHEVVFSVPKFVEDFHAIGFEPDKDPTYPNVVMDDTINGQLFLDLGT